MKMATVNAGEEHSRYVGQVYQKHYATLRRYFLTQLGDAAEAEAGVNETLRLFFLFMEDKSWESHARHARVYLLRIAGGLVCSEKFAAKRARRKNGLGAKEARGMFERLKGGAAQSFKEGVRLGRLLLGAAVGGGVAVEPPPSLRRAPAASA